MQKRIIALLMVTIVAISTQGPSAQAQLPEPALSFKSSDVQDCTPGPQKVTGKVTFSDGDARSYGLIEHIVVRYTYPDGSKYFGPSQFDKTTVVSSTVAFTLTGTMPQYFSSIKKQELIFAAVLQRPNGTYTEPQYRVVYCPGYTALPLVVK